MKNFFKNLTRPTSQNEDKARREFILNVLLLSIISLALISFIINLIKGLMGINIAVSAAITFVPLIFFTGLYVLSRKGYAKLASFILLAILCFLVSFLQYKWGVDLPMEILSQALVIVMAGILISTRAAFIATGTIIAIIATIAYFQKISAIEADRYWITQTWGVADVVIASVLFAIIATVSWLSNREIEKSLRRARRSEADLKKERDSLEITVEERTKELKETQAEKMSQLYRFAEFGRLSSGLFHDLINPLNALSLNMEKGYVDKAIRAAKKLEDLVASVRKQLTRQENKTLFSLNEEIEYVIDVLSHKAKKAHVEMIFKAQSDIKIFGDPIKFNQIALNLTANAIDSGGKVITIRLAEEQSKIILQVEDQGMGIPEENLSKIFEPFFTTKDEGQGIGLGLSMTKRLVEKDFGGALNVSSKTGKGSTFSVTLSKNGQQTPSSN